MGIKFDEDFAPLTAISGKFSKIPSVLRVIACEENRFRSKAISFKPFETIETPAVHYSEKEGIFSVDTMPGYIYRYTIDGSVPSFDSIACKFFARSRGE